MLRVVIELVPHGDESKKEVLDTMTIINTGGHQNRPHFGNYIIRTEGKSKNFPKSFQKESIVMNHYRANNVWDLIKKAVKSFT